MLPRLIIGLIAFACLSSVSHAETLKHRHVEKLYICHAYMADGSTQHNIGNTGVPERGIKGKTKVFAAAKYVRFPNGLVLTFDEIEEFQAIEHPSGLVVYTYANGKTYADESRVKE